MNKLAAANILDGASRQRRLLFVVNNAAFFVSHRLPIAVEARARGYDVAVATPAGEGVAEIEAAGFGCAIVPIARGAATPFADAAVLVALVRLFRRLRPDIVHAVTLKAVAYAGIAARMARVPAFVAAISGLGYTFIDRGDGASRLRGVVAMLCRGALRHPNVRVIFQNDADRDTFVAMGAAKAEDIHMIGGSGVDLEEYAPTAEAAGPPLVVLPSRMLRDKGVAEFAAAARKVKTAGHAARFALVGDVDPGNPASCTTDQVRGYEAWGAVEWWGFRPDMPAVFASAHVVVLPSYREGFPRALMEAAAMGRAVVTTDVPGCRDAITPGVTGLAVRPRDADALAAAIASLLVDPQLRQKMGRAGRLRAEREFGIERVVEAHMAVYRELAVLRNTADGVATPNSVGL